MQIGQFTFVPEFSSGLVEEHIEVQHASFMTASFTIAVVCASPYSETEYEDKLACDFLFDCDRTGND